MSHKELFKMLSNVDEGPMLDFLAGMGVIATEQQCEFCGGNMKRVKDGKTWYWRCSRRVNGVKCNRGKFGVRSGTFVGDSKLAIQHILWFVWHFVHRLSEAQCKQYMSVGQVTNVTVVNWYRACREVCTTWITKHAPKLGGFGKIVEFDESFFAGAPKYGRGRAKGWKDEDEWVFGLVERGTLNCWLEQVDKSRSRKVLLPIINERCKDGTIFCSDTWGAYHKLSEHLQLEDTLQYPVNHKQNFVNPQTGAHSQTVENMWSHCKQYLPAHGMQPKDLSTYLGAFMWHRYAKQHNLDLFKFFLQCAAEVKPFPQKALPVAQLL